MNEPVTDYDVRLLRLVQASFPPPRRGNERPYARLGELTGSGEAEVLEGLRRLTESGVIRRLGAVFDPARLGYSTTLLAARTSAGELERVAGVIGRHPGSSHVYEREGHPQVALPGGADWRPNLWFTLSARGQRRLLREIRKLEELTGCGPFLLLPATHSYKLRVVFDPAAGTASTSGARPATEVTESTEAERHGKGQGAAKSLPSVASVPSVAARDLTEAEKDVVRLLADPLPLEVRPFRLVAERASLLESELLDLLAAWLEHGILRRFGASVNHRRLGFEANGMAVWDCPEEKLTLAGRVLSASAMVSHCYARVRCAEWPYNLYAMLHSETRARCAEEAARLGQAAGLGQGPEMLFSVREFKKEAVRYFYEDGAQS